MSVLQYLDDWLLWKCVNAIDLRHWQSLSVTCRSAFNFISGFLQKLHSLDLSGNGKVSNLSGLARACPNLADLCLNTLLITSYQLTSASTYLSMLQALHLRECPLLTDSVLHSIFKKLMLRSLDVSWAAEFSDAPWAHAPASLREFRGVGCEHLTERVAVHLSDRCPHLEVLHSSRHINWIGASRTELLGSLLEMESLRDVSFQDIPLDDDLLSMLACQPHLSRIQLWSYNSEQHITDEGVMLLARSLGSTLVKLSLDSFVFNGAGVLTALSSLCWNLQELLLEGNAQCQIGRIDGLKLPAKLAKLRLPGCGLVGFMDLSNLFDLHYLWLFDNPGLEGVQGGGQQLKVLNLGSTSCKSIQSFGFGSLDLLDVSSTCLPEKDLAAILLTSPVLTRAVLGGNMVSPALLVAFVQQASWLRNLSLCGVGAGLVALARLLSGPGLVAPDLELLEISEASCPMVAEWLSLESAFGQASQLMLGRSSKDIQIWMIEELEHTSPYGRIDGAADSWLPTVLPR